MMDWASAVCVVLEKAPPSCVLFIKREGLIIELYMWLVGVAEFLL